MHNPFGGIVAATAAGQQFLDREKLRPGGTYTIVIDKLKLRESDGKAHNNSVPVVYFIAEAEVLTAEGHEPTAVMTKVEWLANLGHPARRPQDPTPRGLEDVGKFATALLGGLGNEADAETNLLAMVGEGYNAAGERVALGELKGTPEGAKLAAMGIDLSNENPTQGLKVGVRVWMRDTKASVASGDPGDRFPVHSWKPADAKGDPIPY